MFNKTQYKLLIEQYIDKYDVTYTTAKQLIFQHKLKKYMQVLNISYRMAILEHDIINNYNVSIS